MGLSNIQWCDYTFNPWIGCRFATRTDGTPIEECFRCYAKALDDQRYSKTLDGGTKENPISHWGSGPRHRTSEQNWKQPMRWNTIARPGIHHWQAIKDFTGIGEGWTHQCSKCRMLTDKAGTEVFDNGCENLARPRVFSASLGDWLDDEYVPIEWVADLLRLIHDTPHLDWLLLTKRPQKFFRRVSDTLYREDAVKQFAGDWVLGKAPSNVWIGVSAGADQAAALAIPAYIHFLSCEPMLRPLDTTYAGRFDWIIFGGESGSKARPCNVDWILDGVLFCKENGVDCFVKQLGARPFQNVESPMCDLHPLQDSHGGDISEWPEELRVREFPTSTKHQAA